MIAIAMISGFFLFVSHVPDAGSVTLTPPNETIPKTFFGLHIHRAATSTPWPIVPFGTYRLWDSGMIWPNIQPNKAELHFENLDKLISLAEDNHVDILMTLGMTPPWASARPSEKSKYKDGYAAEPENIQVWRDFLRRIATKYKGRIRYYEIWNEPNLPGFFSGTVENMVSLTKEAYLTLKDVDPTIVVVSPSPTNKKSGPAWLERFLAAGGGKYVDVVAYHFYVSPDPPETLPPFIERIRRIMEKYGESDKPLWNTETGWFIENSNTTVKPKGFGFRGKVLTEEEATAYLARTYILNWAGGVTRFYWYAWDNGMMGLTEADGKTLKGPATAYGAVFDWLVGARMPVCSSDRNEIWTCELVRDEGYRAWIMWVPDRKYLVIPPAEWGVKQVRDLKGGKRILGGKGTVEIGPIPILLENIRNEN